MLSEWWRYDMKKTTILLLASLLLATAATPIIAAGRHDQNGNRQGRDEYRASGFHGNRNGGAYGRRDRNYRRPNDGNGMRREFRRNESRRFDFRRPRVRFMSPGYGYGYNRYEREIWRLQAEIERLQRRIAYLQQMDY
jgi:hypothetical protein